MAIVYYHLFIDGFSIVKHPAIRVPPFMETIYIYIAYIYTYIHISHEQSRLIPICTDRITRSLLTATSLPEARTEVWGNMGHPWTNEKGTHGPMKNMIGFLSWDDDRYNMDIYIYIWIIIVNIQYPSILIRKIYNGSMGIFLGFWM